jgi:acyl carrier protein
VAVLPVNWERYRERGPGGGLAWLARQGVQRQAARPAVPILAQLSVLKGAALLAALTLHLRTELAQVLGYASPEQVDLEQRFTHMGVDSLLAVDLRNRLESQLAMALPVTLLFDHSDLGTLAAELARRLEHSASNDPAVAAVVEAVAGLSDEEAERLLSEESARG